MPFASAIPAARVVSQGTAQYYKHMYMFMSVNVHVRNPRPQRSSLLGGYLDLDVEGISLLCRQSTD